MHYINALQADEAAGHQVAFAVCNRESGELVGSVTIRDIDHEHLQGELSFWIGRPWWKKGTLRRRAPGTRPSLARPQHQSSPTVLIP